MKKNKFLMMLLAWLLLLNQVVIVNKQSVPPEADKPELMQEKVEEETQKAAIAAIIPDIRVLLMTTGYESYGHLEVSGICNGKEFTYTAESPELEKTPLILDGGEEGVTITSIERQCGFPVYHGILEIKKNGDSLNLINEVSLETYLESVVPSEMPSSYETEALMAQAVCARTYAWKHMEGKGIDGYDADVDDSVNYQVYGNIYPQKSTTEAVKETEGMVLCQDGEPVDTYYFSTSAGVTSTDEIWGAERTSPHLKSVVCTFDEELSWSKWNVTIPWEKLEESARLVAGTDCILTGVEIQKKSQSGAVIKLNINTDNGNFSVETEYDVRKFLSPEGCMIEEKDGTMVPGSTLLPSAYFSMEENPGKEIRIIGSGYGHGVGMSQNGANQMAKEGYTFEKILEFFFKNTQLEVRKGASLVRQNDS